MVQAPAMSVVPKPSPAFGTIRASKKRLDRTETDKSPRPACTSAILRTDSSAELAQKPQEIRAVSYTFYGAVCAPRRGPKTQFVGKAQYKAQWRLTPFWNRRLSAPRRSLVGFLIFEP